VGSKSQYTGRVVPVSNARIFDEPVYNYTREFPYLWEEMSVPIGFNADRERAERILLDVADIDIASSTYEIIGSPLVRIKQQT
jgi:small-conductance mechanosensitive channel